MATKKNFIINNWIGYGGYSLAILLAKKINVKILKSTNPKVGSINNYKSPIEDTFINEFIKNNELDLFATIDVHWH